MNYVFDLEANGLNPTKIHCLVAKPLGANDFIKFGPKSIKEGKLKAFLQDVSGFLIGHNIIDYDIPALYKLIDGLSLDNAKGFIDTAIISRALWPDRPPPKNGPKALALKPHSLEAWGYRVGIGKPEHDNWEEYSPEMLNRCTEDVRITELTFYKLQEEAKCDLLIDVTPSLLKYYLQSLKHNKFYGKKKH